MRYVEIYFETKYKTGRKVIPLNCTHFLVSNGQLVFEFLLKLGYLKKNGLLSHYIFSFSKTRIKHKPNKTKLYDHTGE